MKAFNSGITKLKLNMKKNMAKLKTQKFLEKPFIALQK
jgi:hypothetical protein